MGDALTQRLMEAVVGLVSGVLSGQFGVGGGFLTTPAIRLILGYPELVAVGTPLFVMIPGALVGAFGHARRRLADVPGGLALGAAGMPAAVGGAVLATVIGGDVVLVITGAVIVVAAVRMALHASEPVEPPDPVAVRTDGAPLARSSGDAPLIRLALLGVVVGLFSGLLGLGGGSLMVPALSVLFGYRTKRAIGTSLVAVVLLAVPGTVAHHALGNVDVPLALALSVGVVPGALVGARIAAAARERQARTGFAVLMGLAGLLLIVWESGVVPGA